MSASSRLICSKVAGQACAARKSQPQYIATQFALDGLKPAGDNGTYFQKVPLLAVHTIEDKTTLLVCAARTVSPSPSSTATTIVTKDETGRRTADIDAPIVFVGYGIDAPEYHWNDYSGVDVKGKVAAGHRERAALDDENFFKGKATHLLRPLDLQVRRGSAQGAVGVLIIHRTDLASYRWDVVRNSQAIEKSYLQGDPQRDAAAASWIQHDVARRSCSTPPAGTPIDGHRSRRKARLPGHRAARAAQGARIAAACATTTQTT